MKKMILSLILAYTMIFATACTPQPWEVEAEQIAESALPIAASIVSIAVPGSAPIATIVEIGAQALISALQSAQAIPNATTANNVITAVNSLQSDVSQLLAALQVKDPTSTSQATAYANLFAAAIDDIAQIVEQNTNTAVAALDIPAGAIHVTRTGKAKGWKAKQYKKEFKKLSKEYTVKA